MSGSALASLVKGLPEALQRQYEYEDSIVRSGKHLMHSPFFKVHIPKSDALVHLYIYIYYDKLCDEKKKKEFLPLSSRRIKNLLPVSRNDENF